MKRITQLLLSVALGSLFLGSAQAQTPQVFVAATNGIDAGTCTLAAPCRDLTYALTQVTAGGEINIIASGDYAPVAINQAVTIQTAPGVVASIYAASGHAIIIDEQRANVTLRGLFLRGGTNSLAGVKVNQARAVRIERLTVDGFGSQGISFVHKASRNSITNSVIMNCQVGIVVGSTSDESRLFEVAIEDTRVESCFTGIAINSLFHVNSTRATIRHTSVINCLGNGFSYTRNSGTLWVTMDNCSAAHNEIGIYANVALLGRVHVSNSTIAYNAQGLSGNGIYSRGDNTLEVNSINGAFTGLFAAK